MGGMKRYSTGDYGIRLQFKKSSYFNTKAVIDAIGKAANDNLAKAGAYLRKSAQRSMSKSKKAAAPGKPPNVHRGDLKRLIEFAYEASSRSVVVGPVKIPSAGDVPHTLEMGGQSQSRVNPRRLTRRVGDGGEIRIGGRSCATTKRVNTFKGNKVSVTYVHLSTANMADRANRLQEELYGPMVIPSVFIEPRPFMGPALEREQSKLPALWYQSVK